jgi:hypothetical protein
MIDNLKMDAEPHIIVCSSGLSFSSTQNLIPNTWTFIYYNKTHITTYASLKRQQEQANKARMSKVPTMNNLQRY